MEQVPGVISHKNCQYAACERHLELHQLTGAMVSEMCHLGGYVLLVKEASIFNFSKVNELAVGSDSRMVMQSGINR